ncbi:MAG: DciA family protein [Gammaproteobacteria bacterium]
MSLTRSLKEVLGGAPGLAGLLAQARRIGQYDEMVRQLIAEPLKQHCRVATVRGETLVLLADSPVWAARLHFETPALLKRLALTPALSGIKAIQVKVSVRPEGGLY